MENIEKHNLKPVSKNSQEAKKILKVWDFAVRFDLLEVDLEQFIADLHSNERELTEILLCSLFDTLFSSIQVKEESFLSSFLEIYEVYKRKSKFIGFDIEISLELARKIEFISEIKFRMDDGDEPSTEKILDCLCYLTNLLLFFGCKRVRDKIEQENQKLDNLRTKSDLTENEKIEFLACEDFFAPFRGNCKVKEEFVSICVYF